MLPETFTEGDPKFDDVPLTNRDYLHAMRERCRIARNEYLRALGKGSRQLCRMSLGARVKREALQQAERALRDAIRAIV